MIGQLRGTVEAVRGDLVVLDVSGVGYEVSIPFRTASNIPAVGSDVTLHTHLHVREDVMSLYGFETVDERDLFRLLLGVSRIGPRVGLAILSTLETDDLRRAVATDDVAALTAVPGIGKRSAQKLLLELRPKLDVADADVSGSGPLAEVRTALDGLGYQADEIGEALRNLPPDLSVEDALRSALKTLGREAER